MLHVKTACQLWMLCMFQVFCSHLELLTQQLRAVSQRMERLAAPTVDVDSVRSSLTEYQVRPVLHQGNLFVGEHVYIM